MSNIDVSGLAVEDLPTGSFPVAPRADFRLYMAPAVHRGTWAHARQDLSVEVCGVLVGRWEQDDDGPYAVVTDFIQCDNASSKFAEVTFTHESWAQINLEMDTRFADARIVGWYHTHPDFGIFLSDRDCFIHEHFFSNPGQVAYVIDPVREQEGVFAWRDGKPTPLPHYWVGDSIHTDQAAGKPPRDVAGESSSGDPQAGGAAYRPPPYEWTLTLLSWLAVFLLGYLLAGMQSRWEQGMIVEGAVAHYGVHKVMKIGLEENLEEISNRLATLSAAVEQLPDADSELSEEEVQTAAKQREMIAKQLHVCEQALREIKQQFGLSDQERAVLMALVVQKQAELRQAADDAVAKKDLRGEIDNQPDSTEVEPVEASTPSDTKAAPSHPE